MLTKTDLSQMKKVVREEIQAGADNIRTNLRSEIKLTRMEIQSDIRDLSDRVKNLEITSKKLKKNGEALLRGQKRIEKRLAKSADFLDKENLKTKKRLRKVEDHLGITPQESF